MQHQTSIDTRPRGPRTPAKKRNLRVDRHNTESKMVDLGSLLRIVALLLSVETHEEESSELFVIEPRIV